MQIACLLPVFPAQPRRIFLIRMTASFTLLD